jgi:regulator of protease activity HflC (stomatin/prohibitin superfamily)
MDSPNWSEYLFGSVVLLAAIVLVVKSAWRLSQNEALVIERNGKYHRTLKAGLHFIIPFVDRPRALYWRTVETGLDGVTRTIDKLRKRIDTREMLYEAINVGASTSDLAPFVIDVSLSASISDPEKAAYAHGHLPAAVTDAASVAVQWAIGDLSSEQLLPNLTAAGLGIRQAASDQLSQYGIRVGNCEIRAAAASEEIRAAIEKKIAASKNKEAVEIDAEAKAMSMLKEGQSRHQLDLMEAETRRRTIELTAEAEAEALRTIAKAIDNAELARNALSIRYLDVLRQIAGGTDSKIAFIPFDAGGMTNYMELIRTMQDSESTSQS